MDFALQKMCKSHFPPPLHEWSYNYLTSKYFLLFTTTERKSEIPSYSQPTKEFRASNRPLTEIALRTRASLLPTTKMPQQTDKSPHPEKSSQTTTETNTTKKKQNPPFMPTSPMMDMEMFVDNKKFASEKSEREDDGNSKKK